MARLFFRFGNLLFFNRKSHNVRHGLTSVFSALLVFSAVLFTLELLLIFMGAEDIIVPLTASARSLLGRIFF